jgi:hypothetical protein
VKRIALGLLLAICAWFTLISAGALVSLLVRVAEGRYTPLGAALGVLTADAVFLPVGALATRWLWRRWRQRIG